MTGACRSTRQQLKPQDGLMKTKEFLQTLTDLVRQQLPPELTDFQVHPRVTSLTKLYYDRASVHYEVWIQKGRGIVELGLHFEDEPESNFRYLELLMGHYDEIRSSLGEAVELQQWDRGWCRAHETVPLQPLSDDFLVEVSLKLSDYVRTLEPLLRAPSSRG